MTVLIDPPRWPAHGREWSHLVSDVSLTELHAFARRVGVPRRSFSGDHYDVPQERHADLVTAGAVAVEGRELLARLVASGLRVPKRRGEHLLDSRRVHDRRPGTGDAVLDLIASALPVPAAETRLVTTREGRLLVRAGTGELPPVEDPTPFSRIGFHRLRPDDAAWSFVAYVTGEPPEDDDVRPLAPEDAVRLEVWPLVDRLLDPTLPTGERL